MNALSRDDIPVLSGGAMWIAAIILAVSNFVVVLDMTIANVSVPHIAGGLAVSPLEGTYVITSYAVAEAIAVPLTGWLVGRFGAVRTFSLCVLLFGVFSTLCGLAHELSVLVAMRAFQGLSGGPLMPLTQTLLMRIFPGEKKTTAIAIWGTTTLLAPIFGPIMGGYICDNWSWPFIFYINIPITIICGFFATRVLKGCETETFKNPIDFVGLGLLVIWVASLQLMLDEGKNYDWFESTYIVTLLIIAILGFIAFIIWELTEKQPIVDLRVFRHWGYFVSVGTLSLTFGAFFGSIVLTPLWLQSSMGYTATWSGLTTATLGMLAVLVAPIVARLSSKVDPRILVFFGITWMGILTLFRSFAATNITQENIAILMLIQGIGMPFFFLPLTGLALSSVDPHEIASAAGLMSFLRTLSGAFATSIVTTSWDNRTTYFRSELVSILPENMEIQKPILDHIVQGQSIMLATNYIFLISALVLILAGLCIWLVPKPKHEISSTAAH